MVMQVMQKKKLMVWQRKNNSQFAAIRFSIFKPRLKLLQVEKKVTLPVTVICHGNKVKKKRHDPE